MLGLCASGGLRQLIDLRRQNEIRLSQSIHRVRPGRDLNIAPSQQNVGMMSLLLGDFADSIHESKSRFEVGKLEGAHEMMFVNDLPLPRFGQLLMNLSKFVPLQRRHA